MCFVHNNDKSVFFHLHNTDHLKKSKTYGATKKDQNKYIFSSPSIKIINREINVYYKDRFFRIINHVKIVVRTSTSSKKNFKERLFFPSIFSHIFLIFLKYIKSKKKERKSCISLLDGMMFLVWYLLGYQIRDEKIKGSFGFIPFQFYS